MLKIKLYPRGKKHQRTFRIVVAEGRSKFNGKFVDDLGFWTPQTKTIQIDQVKVNQWTKNGAQITIGVDKLLHPDKYPRKKKTKAVLDTTPKPSAPETPPEAKTETPIQE